MDIRQELERALRKRVSDFSPLGGGCVGQVYLVSTADGTTVVAKIDESGDSSLDVEAYMLDFLGDHSALPVPDVIIGEPRLLVISYLPGRSRFSKAAQEHAAHLLADLHAQHGPAFGFERPTLIAGLHQPNDWAQSWLQFFGEQRLCYMAGLGAAAGRLPDEIVRRVNVLADDLHSHGNGCQAHGNRP